MADSKAEILQDKWVKRVIELVGTMGFIELIQLLEDLRCVCRITRPIANEESLKTALSKVGLTYIRSPYPIKPLDNYHQLAGFDLLARPDESIGTTNYMYYISKSESLAVLAAASETQNPELQGQLYGYPPCCVAFFRANFTAKNKDLISHIGKAHSQPSFFINRLAMITEVSLISHFPCCWDCEKSIQLARNTYKALQKVKPDLADRCLEIQNNNVFYSPSAVIFTKTANGQNVTLPGDVSTVSGNIKKLTMIKAVANKVYAKFDTTWNLNDEYCYLPFYIN